MDVGGGRVAEREREVGLQIALMQIFDRLPFIMSSLIYLQDNIKAYYMVAKCVTGTRLKSEYDGDQQDLNSIDRQTERYSHWAIFLRLNWTCKPVEIPCVP